MTNIVSPVAVERRLIELSKELDEAYQELEESEHEYVKAKCEYEIAIASACMAIRESGMSIGAKITVQELQYKSLLSCRTQYTRYHTADAIVRSARANTQRLRTQVDIARSVGTSVRLSMEAV